MIAKAFLYTTSVVIALYLFTDAPTAIGGEIKTPAFETCETLDYVGGNDKKFEDFSSEVHDFTEADYGNKISACGSGHERKVNLVDPAGKMNAEYDFFTGQKEVRID